MGVFTGRVDHLSGTKIFARMTTNDRGEIAQYLVYSMCANAEPDVAMILPLPVSRQTEDAVDFIPLDDYTEFFEDLEKGFSAPTTCGPGSPNADGAESTQAKLAVRAAGDFVASFVPALADFERLDARFRLPAATWEKLPRYSDWGFAVLQLTEHAARLASADGTIRRFHPTAFLFPTFMDESLYFPTLQVFNGQVGDSAEFDHTLYFQGDEFEDFADAVSPLSADAFMKMDTVAGIVQPDAAFGKLSIMGTCPNDDTYVSRPG